jgi:hypothetical protein
MRHRTITLNGILMLDGVVIANRGGHEFYSCR